MMAEKRKYILMVGDGMGDYPMEELGGRTPLQAAKTPNMDSIASKGVVGEVKTIPEGMDPGSDVATLSLMGYDPGQYHTGRSPLEAAAMGVDLGPEDVAFRCNLVTLAEEAGETVIKDYSAGHISNEEAEILINALQQELGSDDFTFYPGVSYRHLLVWRGGNPNMATTPPHDVTGQAIAGYWECYKGMPEIDKMISRAREILAAHPVNEARRKKGLGEGNSIWLWGQGLRPDMPTLRETLGLSGAVVSAVDLVKGIGVYAGLEPIDVPGATGYLDTNYQGKVDATLEALKERDFVFLHVEAPDEAGHEGSLKKKLQAIEDFDAKVVGPVLEGLDGMGPVTVIVAADHLTPVSVRTHTPEPPPFAACLLPFREEGHPRGYTERDAARGILVEKGHLLLGMIVKGEIIL